MNHLSLFNGIGGFQLAAHWAGWNNVAHVEIDDFCNKVVAKHFPESQCFKDIKQFDGKQFKGSVDVISGGFPCQPYSLAGKRKGTEDDRHLWPEMLRTIREVQPGWVVGENVYGLVNWNGGVVFDQVHTDLENEGYEVTSYILSSCSINTDHDRRRLFIVAHSSSSRLQDEIQQQGRTIKGNKKSSSSFVVPFIETGIDIFRDNKDLRANDGVSNWMDRIKSLGNAIVPQVAYQIFKAINEYDQTSNRTISK